MTTIDTLAPLAVAAVAAIHIGDTAGLQLLLDDHPDLAGARLGDDDADGMSRSLLHVATDWPGHFPEVRETIRLLVASGAEVDARFRGPHEETALHWAASSNDVEAVNALLDAGADINPDGGVIAGGTPLGDATAFGQWDAARALVARGATAGVFDLAALGMTDELVAVLDAQEPPDADAVNHALWSAAHGGHLVTVKATVARGGVINWVPGWENATPLDIAARSASYDVIRWLHSQGALTHSDLVGC